MHILRTNFNGNPGVRLYVFATDKFALVGKEISKTDAIEIEKALKVPIHQLTIAGTSLVGIFVAGNSKKILVPKITFDYELLRLKELGIDYSVISTKNTALGNNILANDKGGLINPEFEESAVKEIEQALGFKVKKSKIAGLEIVGALCVHNDKGGLIHHNASDNDIEMVNDILKVECKPGTVNFGSPYISSGLVTNDKGFIIGDTSGGPEIQNADEALGFMDLD